MRGMREGIHSGVCSLGTVYHTDLPKPQTILPVTSPRRKGRSGSCPRSRRWRTDGDLSLVIFMFVYCFNGTMWSAFQSSISYNGKAVRFSPSSDSWRNPDTPIAKAPTTHCIRDRIPTWLLKQIPYAVVTTTILFWFNFYSTSIRRTFDCLLSKVIKVTVTS